MILAGLVLVVIGVSWWLSGRLANRRSSLFVLDHPNERSLHDRPTPRTGGVAILAGLFSGLVLAVWVGFSLNGVADPTGLGWPISAWIMLLTYGIGVVSFLDDWRGVPVSVRFGIHLLAASMLVVGGRLWIPAISFPVLGSVDLGWLAVPVSIGLLVWMTNLYNFMDGMDGFAGGMTVAGGGVLAGLGAAAGHGFLWVTAAYVAAAALGFLCHNFPPAKIFMGDVGSVSLGFLFGSLMLLGVHEQVFDFWVPIVLFSPFIVDATVTLIRRSVRGEHIWQAHRTHYYQRLVLLGWGHRRAVMAEYVLMMYCAGIALLYQFADQNVQLILLAVWCMSLVGLMSGVSLIEGKQKASE